LERQCWRLGVCRFYQQHWLPLKYWLGCRRIMRWELDRLAGLAPQWFQVALFSVLDLLPCCSQVCCDRIDAQLGLSACKLGLAGIDSGFLDFQDFCQVIFDVTAPAAGTSLMMSRFGCRMR
jgi:hypothetical protein